MGDEEYDEDNEDDLKNIPNSLTMILKHDHECRFQVAFRGAGKTGFDFSKRGRCAQESRSCRKCC